MKGILLVFVVLFGVTVKSQDTTMKGMKHSIKDSASKDMNKTNRNVKPVTGAGTGIMPESKSNGKVTNNPKGKAGPQDKKNKKFRNTKYPHRTIRPNNDTGAGTGIMPKNKSNGKVTNNPKGKAGPQDKKNKKFRNTKYPYRTIRPNNDTGAGTGIMPKNKSNGKVTNNPKGKAGPTTSEKKPPF